ncbi:transcription elongation factor [Ravibacter arvi]|uniref:transcription elongation factor n=1 Tax=Ravibacter arvi TaxID=2051041 RepID=UPI0031F0CBCA
MASEIIPDKRLLLELVRDRLQAAVIAAKQAMDASQEAANSEGKSSMGDKYETGRAMAQIDRDMYAQRYDQLKGELEALDRITAGDSSSARLGSLVKTSLGYVLLAVSMGVVETDWGKVLVVSTQSPLGRAVLGRQAGDVFVFQGKGHKLSAVL